MKLYLKLLFDTVFREDNKILSISQSMTKILFYHNFPFRKIKQNKRIWHREQGSFSSHHFCLNLKGKYFPLFINRQQRKKEGKMENK